MSTNFSSIRLNVNICDWMSLLHMNCPESSQEHVQLIVITKHLNGRTVHLITKSIMLVRVGRDWENCQNLNFTWFHFYSFICFRRRLKGTCRRIGIFLKKNSHNSFLFQLFSATVYHWYYGNSNLCLSTAYTTPFPNAQYAFI